MSGFLKRVPLLLVAALGIWLWQSGRVFPQKRELVWELGRSRAPLQSLEVQLYDADGELLKRESWRFDPAKVPSQVQQTLSLRDGTYPVRVFLGAPDGGTEQLSRELTVKGDEPLFQRVH